MDKHDLAEIEMKDQIRKLKKKMYEQAYLQTERGKLLKRHQQQRYKLRKKQKILNDEFNHLILEIEKLI